MGTLIYKLLLRAQGPAYRFWTTLRSLLIRLQIDPVCTLLINDRLLRLPLSHNLPLYQKQFPLYDHLPVRLSRYIHQTYGYLKCIDVGANIGDSIAAFFAHETDAFLAIEPNPNFRNYLVANWGQNSNVVIEAVICSATHAQTTFAISEHLSRYQ